jgi:DNA-binding LytR/AlgR family response regulator
MNKIQCLVVDDEALARKLIENHIEKLDYLQLVGSFENPLDVLSFIKTNSVDLIFLDIQMPEIKGTDLAEVLASSFVRVIFTTAYSEYAIQGYDLNALDYLLKPITFKRFYEAVSKYPKKISKSNDDDIIIKSGYDLHKVSPNEIVFIQSEGEYVNYQLESGKKIMANQSLSKLEKKLPHTLIRVHRSFIVNRNKIKSLKGRELLVGSEIIPVSDSYYGKVKRLFS